MYVYIVSVKDVISVIRDMNALSLPKSITYIPPISRTITMVLNVIIVVRDGEYVQINSNTIIKCYE